MDIGVSNAMDIGVSDLPCLPEKLYVPNEVGSNGPAVYVLSFCLGPATHVYGILREEYMFSCYTLGKCNLIAPHLSSLK